MNFGLIGLGFGQNYIRCINEIEGGKIIGTCSLNRKSYENSIKPKNSHYWTRDYEEICEDKNIDTVIIASSAAMHKEMAMCALYYNKAVILEKPVCLTLEDSVAVLDKAALVGKSFIVNFVHCWNPDFIKILNDAYVYKDENFFIEAIHRAHGPFRRDCNAFYDYLPHTLALTLSFFDKCLPEYCQMLSSNSNIHSLGNMFSANLKFGEHECWINAGNLAAEKAMSFSVRTNSNLWEYKDSPKHNALKNMLLNFIYKDDASPYTNIDLARRVAIVMDNLF